MNFLVLWLSCVSVTIYRWVGIGSPHQLNSCQNFNLLKQINNKQNKISKISRFSKRSGNIPIFFNNSWVFLIHQASQAIHSHCLTENDVGGTELSC